MNSNEDKGFEIICPCRPDKVYIKPTAKNQHYICVEKLPFGHFACHSPYCPDHNKRVKAKWNKKAKSGEGNSKLWAITLPMGLYISADALRKAKRAFNKRMRRKGRVFEYFWVIHDDGGVFNFHLLAKTLEDITNDEVEENWRWAMARHGQRKDLKCSCYCEPCYSWPGYVSYVIYGKSGEPLDKIPKKGLWKNLYGVTKRFQEI